MTLTASPVSPQVAAPQPAPRGPGHLLAPAFGTGALMVAYLLLRPYGDPAGGMTAAAAFDSERWVPAHVCGALALASFARLALRLHDLRPSRLTTVARWSGLAGAALALPAYGGEAFGLHAIGTHVMAHPESVDLIAHARDGVIGAAMLFLGLAGLAVSGITTALAWQRSTTGSWQKYAAWPLGVGIALVIPQFLLPAGGRMAFGILYAAAAALLIAATRARS